MIYLDSAATSFPKPVSVGRAMGRALAAMSSPGRGGYEAALLASDTLLECRLALQRLFHVPEPENVVFTLNATHALNIAIRSLVPPGGRAVISGWEHNAVTRPLHALGAEVRAARGRLFDDGVFLEDWEKALEAGADAAVCTQVSNVFGWALPIREAEETGGMELLRRTERVTVPVSAAVKNTVVGESVELPAADGEVRLSVRECAMLAALGKGGSLSRTDAAALFGSAAGNVVDVYACYLRKKLGKVLTGEIICARRGEGYALAEDVTLEVL